MNPKDMLEDMCNKYLSDADIKAIAKNRGFSTMEISSRQVFQNYFLSDLGLKKAISSLNIKEQCLLHFLNYKEKIQDISVFDRIYDVNEPDDFFQTATQKYKDTYRNIHNNMVRKGVLLVSEKPKRSSKRSSKLDRLRFIFPNEFVPFLPPIIDSRVSFDDPDAHHVDMIRNMLVNMTTSKNDNNVIHLQDKIIKVGNNLFTLNNLKNLQYISLGKKVFERESLYPLQKEILDKWRYIFSQLNSNMWFVPNDLKHILDVFCHDHLLPSYKQICQIAWESGLLKQYTHGKKTYYAVEDEMDDSDLVPDGFIEIARDQSVMINLNTIPFQELVHISKISDFYLKKARLIAMPNLIKAGQNWTAIENQPVFEWLVENSDLYKQMCLSIEKKRGQCLVHKNLCVAQIKDLSLRVKVEKALSGNYKLLSEEFIAFPLHKASEVETVVKKSGYAVKLFKKKESLQ